MQSTRTRIDRFISRQLGVNRGDVRLMLAQGRVKVDGCLARDIQQPIHQFSHITFDTRVLQAKKPRYVMMHKPAGIVSATRDHRHTTVTELLDEADRCSLHIAGRLDFNSSGLLLLTNDGHWSRYLSAPENNLVKLYRVELEQALSDDYIRAFSDGMYFAYEGITTRPAKLRIVSDHIAEVSLTEGRYHQIKRMFGRFNNRVLRLHRLSIGQLSLDPQLVPGQSRELSKWEVDSLAGAAITSGPLCGDTNRRYCKQINPSPASANAVPAGEALTEGVMLPMTQAR